MKYLIPIFISFVFAAVGFLSGMQYEESMRTYNAEAIIGKEIALLEKHKNVPGCDNIRNISKYLNTTETTDAIIVWQYNRLNDALKRNVIDRDFNFAYEEIEHYCMNSQ